MNRPDALHWLGITKIHKFISMSDMKYDAIINSGIKIVERIPIPPELIPKDAQVEIAAKVLIISPRQIYACRYKSSLTPDITRHRCLLATTEVTSIKLARKMTLRASKAAQRMSINLSASLHDSILYAINQFQYSLSGYAHNFNGIDLRNQSVTEYR